MEGNQKFKWDKTEKLNKARGKTIIQHTRSAQI